MGIMGATGANSVAAEPLPGGDVGESDGADGADDAADGADGAEAVADAVTEGGQPRRESRRERAARELTERVTKNLQGEWSKQNEASQQRIAMLEQQLAHTRGAVETFQRQPQQQPQQAQGPDPVDLRRQAKRALDPGGAGYDEYERLTQQATEIEVDRRVKTAVAEATKSIQQQIPQTQNPLINTLLAKHTNVALAGDRGELAVGTKLNEIRIMTGHQGPPTPQMMAKAFELADTWLASLNKTPAAPAYGRDPGGAAIPTQRGGNSNGEGGGGDAEANLTEAQKAAMRAGGFKNAAEYLKWGNPQSWVKKW